MAFPEANITAVVGDDAVIGPGNVDLARFSFIETVVVADGVVFRKPADINALLPQADVVQYRIPITAVIKTDVCGNEDIIWVAGIVLDDIICTMVVEMDSGILVSFVGVVCYEIVVRVAADPDAVRVLIADVV